MFLLPPSNPYLLSSHLTTLFLHSVYKSAPAFYRPSLLGFLSNQKCRGLIAEGFVSLTYGANKATGSFLHNDLLSTCSCYLLFQTWLFKGSSCGPTVFICTSELGLQFAGNKYNVAVKDWRIARLIGCQLLACFPSSQAASLTERRTDRLWYWLFVWLAERLID